MAVQQACSVLLYNIDETRLPLVMVRRHRDNVIPLGVKFLKRL